MLFSRRFLPLFPIKPASRPHLPVFSCENFSHPSCFGARACCIIYNIYGNYHRFHIFIFGIAAREVRMARIKEGGRLKKHNCCLTCSIVCFVLLLVFVATLFIGGSILFKSYVSPHIGGLGLGDALSLAGDVFAGKKTKPDYSEEDLDSFYSALSSALFLSDKSEDELEYALISEETRATLAASFSAAESESSGETPAYDEDAAYAAFLLKNETQRYALLTEDIKAILSQAEYAALAADTDQAAAARKKAGLKLYRLSLDQLLGDTDFDFDDFSVEDTVEELFSSLEFNFDNLENYDIHDAAAEQNEKFTTFSVTGKQASAFIDDIVRYMVTNEGSPVYSYVEEYIPEGVDITKYIKVASVTIMNTPLATAGDSAIYDQKDTALGITLSFHLREIVRQALKSDKLKKELSMVPSFARSLIPSLVPTYFTVQATVYPLADEADGREIAVRINKASDSHSKKLATLLNGLFSSKKNDGGITKTFFGELNDQVVKVFSEVNERVKINFVPSKDGDGNTLKDAKGNTYSEMKIMTWETLLTLLEDQVSLTPHEVFTMLKCLYIATSHEELTLDSALTEFKSDIASKYGLASTYFDDRNIFSQDDFSDLLDYINISNLDFSQSNESMRVRLSAEAIGSFLSSFVNSESTSTAAAESSDAKEMLENLDPKVCSIKIDRVSDTDGVKVFSFELLISVSLSDFIEKTMEEKFDDEDMEMARDIARKILPKGRSYFGMLLYLSEETVGDKVVHKVGKAIDEPAEGETSLYASKIRVNDFTYDETSIVLDTLDKILEAFSSDSFDLSSVTDYVEDAINEAFDALAAAEDFNVNLYLYPSDEQGSKGGITLPSLYELLESLVKAQLSGTESETFTVNEAQSLLQMIYINNLSYDENASYDDAFSGFKTELAAKYGLAASYFDDHNLFAGELGDMLDFIHIGDLDFALSDEEMKVHLSADAIAYFLYDYIKPEAASAAVAAAEEDTSDVLKDLDPKICALQIQAVPNQENVYSLEVVLSLSLSSFLESRFGDNDDFTSKMVRKILPEGSTYVGIKLFISETTDGDTVLHKVGKAIDEPEEGQPSAYASRIRINEFNYDETESLMNTITSLLNKFAAESFTISSITDYVEDAINGVFDSLASSDFNLALRLYSATDDDNGGLTLPSLYELIVSLVKPKLGTTDTFSVEDAQSVLQMIYNYDTSLIGTKTYSDSQANEFLADINDKFYIKKASELTVSDLFGDGAGGLSSKLSADAIYFKESAAEAALWEEEKLSLYGDTRSINDLRVSLTGSELASLVESSNMLPDTLASSFGSLEVMGAQFKTEDGKTYLCFNIKLSPSLGGEGDSFKYANFFPSALKFSAKILLYAASYTANEPRYSVSIEINDQEEQTRSLLLLINALSDDDISLDSLTDDFAESIATVFNTLEGVIDLSYSNGGTAYSLTIGDKTEECIKIADVFTFLAGATSMKDSDLQATDPADLAARLRAFGQQTVSDAENAGVYTWVSGLKLFTNDDFDYVYENMERAYFLNAAPSMTDIYSGFSSLFDSIGSSFNLTGSNGLFYYDGDILNLKISDRALGCLVKEKQSFAGAVSGSGIAASIESLKISFENTNLVIETGIKITFANTHSAFGLMPSYFFVKAKTVKSGGNYTTTICINNLSAQETTEFFANILSLASKGVDSSSFDQADIVSTINTAISTALGSFPASVTYGLFTQSEITNEYGDYTASSLPEANDGYISFPSLYSYLIDMFYTSGKPTEKQMQHMLVSLHTSDSALSTSLVTNPKSSTSTNHVNLAYNGTSPLNMISILSDKYLAYQLSSLFTSESLNGNLTLSNGIDQLIVLRGLTSTEEQGERDTWKDKFFTGSEDYTLSHTYVIATASVSLGGLYGSGDGISLLPNNLWFTVLADLNDPSLSKGLLYDMDHTDMAIFQHILNSDTSNTAFSIDSIAEDFAQLIKDKIDDISEVGGYPATITYKLSEDDFLYSSDYNTFDPSTANNFKDHADGVGYIVLSIS